MHVGVYRLELHLPVSRSLKDKRQVARSLSARIRDRFNVSVAEEPDDNLHQRLTLVVACVSTEVGHAHQTLSRVVDFVQDTRRDLEVMDVEVEVLSGL